MSNKIFVEEEKLVVESDNNVLQKKFMNNLDIVNQLLGSDISSVQISTTSIVFLFSSGLELTIKPTVEENILGLSLETYLVEDSVPKTNEAYKAYNIIKANSKTRSIKNDQDW